MCKWYRESQRVNPSIAKFFILNFHSLKAVSRSRDPQLQVDENDLDLSNYRSRVFFKFYIYKAYFKLKIMFF